MESKLCDADHIAFRQAGIALQVRCTEMQLCDAVVMHIERAVIAERIIVATDLQDINRLLPHATAQAEAMGASITLVHAISPMYASSLEGAYDPVPRATILQRAKDVLLERARGLIPGGIRVDTAVRIGSAGDVVWEELQRAHRSMLMMGTHGRGPLLQLAMGSVAHQILPKAKIPVFIVGPHSGVRHALPRRILHPVSFASTDYRESCATAIKIAASYGAELTLLHVVEDGFAVSADPQRSMLWAKTMLRALIPETPVLKVNVQVAQGAAAGEILRTAAAMDADWIVLGLPQHPPTSTFREAMVFEVVGAARCPVLTLGREAGLADAASCCA